jgi:hypothetical protein
MTGSSLAKIVLAARARLAFFEAISATAATGTNGQRKPLGFKLDLDICEHRESALRPAKIAALLT